MTAHDMPPAEASGSPHRHAPDAAQVREPPSMRRGCIAIAGPTASGKTAAALAIAQRWPVEIVSVDSALVYRGMDIGTAKPSEAERAQVPHHLIDIRDPLNAYSAAEFVNDARRLIDEIQARGRTALLVGGTMLYFKALMQGLDAMPPADALVREAIAERARALGWPALHVELQRVDPITAARLPPNDSQRIARALEVHTVTGQPLSSFQTGGASAQPSPIAAGALLDRDLSHPAFPPLVAGSFTALRTISTAGGSGPGVEANLLKIKGSEIQQRFTELFLDAAGMYGLPFDPERGAGQTNEPPIGPDGVASLAPNYLMTRVVTIYGGSNEIQRNIIAKNLGL